MPVRDLSKPGPVEGDPIPMGLLPAYHAARNPLAPAITEGDQTIGFAELEARANRRARRLEAAGVGLDDVVVLAAPKGIIFYEWSFAIWKLGASVCQVSSSLPAVEFEAILDLAQPRAVVSTTPVRRVECAVFDAREALDETLSIEALPARTASHWKISTSGGSTGRPKLIVDRGPSLWNPSQGVLGIEPGDVVINPAPLYHTAPFGFMHTVLFTGGHVVELPRFDPVTYLAAVAQWRASWAYLVPTMMHRISRLSDKEKRHDLSSLEVIIHMAAACPAWLKQEWIDWLGPDVIWELYGGTEVLGATLINGEEWLAHPGSVGRLWMGTGMKILDEAGEPCPPGVVGEIYFHVGDAAPYRYIGAVARVSGDWQSFGDMGWMDADGYLYIADKRTDMIVTGGANVYPAEVEAAIEAHPGVASCVVVGLPDDDFGHRIHAIVQATNPDVREDGALKRFLADRLAAYKIPKAFEFVDVSLRSDDGKVRRSAYRDARLGS